MAHTCITAIKIIGLGSVGLLTSSLSYQSLQQIPKLINELGLSIGVDSGVKSKINCLINGSRLINGILVGLSSLSFWLSYKYSPVNEKHPYLVYAGIGSLLSYGYTYYKALNVENKLIEAQEPHSVQVNNNDTSSADKKPSGNEGLDNSYIHVSDEDSTSSNTPSPPQSTPASPKPDIDYEINLSLFKKDIVNDLTDLKAKYVIGSGLFGLTFLISSIGVIGDYCL